MTDDFQRAVDASLRKLDQNTRAEAVAATQDQEKLRAARAKTMAFVEYMRRSGVQPSAAVVLEETKSFEPPGTLRRAVHTTTYVYRMADLWALRHVTRGGWGHSTSDGIGVNDAGQVCDLSYNRKLERNWSGSPEPRQGEKRKKLVRNVHFASDERQIRRIAKSGKMVLAEPWLLMVDGVALGKFQAFLQIVDRLPDYAARLVAGLGPEVESYIEY